MRHISRKSQELGSRLSFELGKSAEMINQNACVKLIVQGADPNIRDFDGKTALMNAANKNLYAVCEALIMYGADLNAQRSPSARTDDGASAIYLAAARGHDKILQLLLNKGAKPDTPVKGGLNALFVAVISKKTACIDALLAAGADPNVREGDGGWTMLTHCFFENDMLHAKKLITAGADINLAGRSGYTPLMEGVLSIVSVEDLDGFLNLKPDLNALSNEGHSALWMALSTKRFDKAELLLKHGADIHIKHGNNETLLHKAVASKNIPVIGFLCNNGFCKDTPDTHGKTALELAEGTGRDGVLQAMKEIIEQKINRVAKSSTILSSDKNLKTPRIRFRK